VRRPDGRPEGATLHRQSFLRSGSKHPDCRERLLLRGGRCKRESRSTRVLWPSRARHSSRSRTRADDKGCSGPSARRGSRGVHSLEEWAHSGPSRCLQAAARRPRPTSLAMMARRVVARRHDAKKWWALSTNAAHSGLVPDAAHQAGASRARSEQREPARSRNVDSTRKGKQRGASSAPDGGTDRRGSPGGASRRNANRATARRGRGSRAQSACPRVVSQVADFDCSHDLSLECRKATRGSSSGWTTRPSSQDARPGSCSRQKVVTDRRKASRIVASRFLHGRGRSDLDPTRTTQADLQGRKRDPGRVTGCQRRSRERSEIRFAGKPLAFIGDGEYPSSLPHDPSKRVQRVVKRRTLRSHHPLRWVTKQAGNPERGCRFRKAVDGRSRSDASLAFA